MSYNKYSAIKTKCAHGHTHDSKREAARCAELHLLFRAGQIDALVYAPIYRFNINGRELITLGGQKAHYRPDFVYLEGGGLVAEDVKSRATLTDASKLRLALFRHCYPEIELRIVS